MLIEGIVDRAPRYNISLMTAEEKKKAAERLRIAFDLHEAGVRMMRQTLRRRHPDASEEEVQRRLIAWLHERPGAEHGDAVGRPGTWPRTRGS